MAIKKDFSLKNFNTFGIDIKAKYFFEASNQQSLLDILSLPEYANEKKLFLGQGSNILFTKNFDGLVIKINLIGIEKISETEQDILIKVGAGNIWHDFVLYCIEKSYGGLENLSLIPGTVGASPIQNIGAYGVELKDVFHSLEAIEIKTGNKKVFDKIDCEFGYRNSVFKNKLKNQYIITSVTFKLNKNNTINTSYGDIQKKLAEKTKDSYSIKDVSEAVCEIRKSKLPNPKEIGNAGSFFKNPEIDIAIFEKIKLKYPEITSYKLSDPNKVKVPAGWLIEKCGWKGKTFDNYGVHKNQALVLVNYGGADGNKIKKLSEEIKKSVFEFFEIELETEVNII